MSARQALSAKIAGRVSAAGTIVGLIGYEGLSVGKGGESRLVGFAAAGRATYAGAENWWARIDAEFGAVVQHLSADAVRIL